MTRPEECTYSVMVVRRSLSLRFCSSSCASFSFSCERVASRQPSSSFAFSWSLAASSSASWSWYCILAHLIVCTYGPKYNFRERNEAVKPFWPVCSDSGSPPVWAGLLGIAPESRCAAGFPSSARFLSDTSSSGCWCVCLGCGSAKTRTCDKQDVMQYAHKDADNL